VMLEIQDNGTGFEMQEEGSGEKHGVRNMRDRARSLGASLFLDSQPGEGTIVRLELPVGQRRGRAHG
jgi:signal transduction histidine kinase